MVVNYFKPPLRRFFKALRQCRRRAELRHSLPKVTGQQLVYDLERLPIRQNAPVLVHSSLKALGFVEGGAQTVIDALIDVVVGQRQGTLVFPTYSIIGTMEQTLKAGRLFNVRTTPCSLGALPETFRQRPEAIRSLHPTHSFAALGPLARWIVSEHHCAGTNFGTNTPMIRLMEAQGQLLGLGTTLGTITFYHCIEDIEPFPFPVYTAAYKAHCIDYDGRLHDLCIPAHDPSMSGSRIDRPESHALRDFYGRWFTAYAGLTWHRVGAARCWLIEASALYRETKRLLDAGLTIYSTSEAVTIFHSSHPVPLISGEL